MRGYKYMNKMDKWDKIEKNRYMGGNGVVWIDFD